MNSPQQVLGHIRKKAAEIKQKSLADVTARVIVGTATCGVSAGARAVVNALNQEIEARGLKGALVAETGCSGRCDLEPLVTVNRDGEPPVLYYHVTPDKARRIVQQHVQNGEVIQEWAIT